jgi:hypothetical protein
MKKGLYKLTYGYSQHTLLFVTTDQELSNLVKQYEVITFETSKHQYEDIYTSEIILVTTDTSVIKHIVELGLNDIGRIESYFEDKEPEELILVEPTKWKRHKSLESKLDSINGLSTNQLKLFFQEVEEKFRLKIDLSISELLFSDEGFRKLFESESTSIQEEMDYELYSGGSKKQYENYSITLFCINIHEDDPFNTINWDNLSVKEEMYTDVLNKCGESIKMGYRLLDSERLGDYSYVFFPVKEDIH